jgi:hypothetical protein
MTSLPDLLMQMGPAWHVTLAAAAGCLWLAALRRVIRDLRHESPIRPDQARCGLPKVPMGRSPLLRYLDRNADQLRSVPRSRAA